MNFDCFFTNFDFWFKHFNFDFFKALFDFKVATFDFEAQDGTSKCRRCGCVARSHVSKSVVVSRQCSNVGTPVTDSIFLSISASS